MAIRFRASPYPRNSEPFKDLVDLIEAVTHPTLRDVEPVSDAIRTGFVENFSSESSEFGAWRPLAQSTVLERASLGYGGRHPMLFRTGSYYRTFVNQGNPDHVREFFSGAAGWTLSEGSQDYRADVHEFGTGEIPARPVTSLTNPQIDRIGDALEEMIDTIERRARNA